MRRTCLIVNADQQDKDVELNLVLFYEACGFRVEVDTAPRKADLLVIQRTNPLGTGPAPGIDAREVHVYDYSKSGNLDFMAAALGVRDYRLITLDAAHPTADPRASLHRGNHPVMVDAWTPTEALPEIEYGKLHIGHRKAAAADDPVQLAFERSALASKDCHFFGGGWEVVEGMGKRSHGLVTLHEVQQIYRRSANAFGIMYPYQRGCRLSGRMWQAPLNGCRIFSEALPPGMDLPGVVLTADYREMGEALPALPLDQRHRLVREARDYWREDTRRLALDLGLKMDALSSRHIEKVYRDVVVSLHRRLLVRRQLSRVKQAIGLKARTA